MYVELRSADALLEAARSLAPGEGEQLMVWAAYRSAPVLADALGRLADAGVPCFGSVFPGLLVGRRRLREGAVVNAVPVAGGPWIVDMRPDGRTWSAEPPELAEDVGEAADAARPPRKLTAIVLVDCLSPGISDLLKELFHRYGGRVNYFGAGGGTERLEPGPVVFGAGSAALRRSAAVVALLDLSGAISVRHGWSRARGPFVATRTTKNVIEELNWEPALEVYQRELAAGGSGPITPDNFFHATAGYPFGIEKEGAEDLVRDPIQMTERGALVCLSDVPEQSVMHVMRSDLASLTGAVTRALEDCRAQTERPPRRCFLADCFSRALLLGEDFEQELDAMANTLEPLAPGVAPEGVLALGEIASDGRRMPEFHNKTFVAGMFDG